MAKLQRLTLAFLVLLAGFAGGWAARAPRNTDDVPTPEVMEPTAWEPVSNPPDRPPEFFGVVEGIHPSWHGHKFMCRVDIRCQSPPPGLARPSDKSLADGGQFWLDMRQVFVDNKGEWLSVGSLVSVWHKGDQMRSKPAGYTAEYILVQRPAAR